MEPDEKVNNSVDLNEENEQTVSLEQREAELAAREKALATGEEKLRIREEELDRLYSAFESREKETNESFEDKAKELAERESDVLQKELDAKTNISRAEAMLRMLSEKQSDLEKTREELSAREAAVAESEMDREKELRAMREQAEKEIADMKSAQLREEEKMKEQLRAEREQAEKEIADMKSAQLREEEKMNEQLMEKREKAEQEISEMKASRLLETEKECERLRINAERELSAWRAEQNKAFSDSLAGERKAHIEATEGRLIEIQAATEALNKKREELELKRSELTDAQDRLASDRKTVEQNKRILEVRSKWLDSRIDNFNNDVENRANELFAELKGKADASETQCEILRKIIGELNDKLESFETMVKVLGDNPTAILKKIKNLEQQLRDKNDIIANLPDESVRKELMRVEALYNDLCKERNNLVEEKNAMSEAVHSAAALQAQVKLAEVKNNELEDEKRILTDEIGHLKGVINRLNAAEGQAAERIERIRALFELEKRSSDFAKDGEQPENELKWLQNISKCCTEYQISFPKRILYAFHTALKIADWSTVTVLAGVSGTGKSELPRLYSAFGGINFISVPVQPNWDSQEAMLGYFNSIDNRFDAQPLLRFLVQSTEDLNASGDDNDLSVLYEQLKANGYQSYNEGVSLVLLDEMNLAHVELYFADFLSKLETRRGKVRKFVPSIEVKLGAGITPYRLKLKRNVLWAGTMNQDETTKSLSDKVLDRGIVINFPRPKKLNERTKLEPLDVKVKNLQIPLLKWTTWTTWQKTSISFNNAQMKEMDRFKGIIEDINNCLAEVGRALGHRVWQSIEFYIANYPEVIAEMDRLKNSDNPEEISDALRSSMHTAFEDQLVQKVMPKLRGIDTKGRSKERCLDKIKDILVQNNFNLTEDFDIACRLGYGQFIWSSANYIDTEEKAEKDIVPEDVEAKPGDEQA